MSEQAFNLNRPTRRRFLAGTGAAGALVASGMASILKAAQVKPTPKETSAPAHPVMAEPNMETALGWWSELPNKWTPVGWKDHLFRFNVLFNGTIMAQPDLNRRTEAWKGQGVQLEFLPSATAACVFADFPAPG